MNPYEGILLNILFSYDSLKENIKYDYPKHPFVHFANELKEKFQNKEKIYTGKKTAE